MNENKQTGCTFCGSDDHATTACPMRFTTIDREELARLRADSSELARVRDLAKEAIDFAEELGEESDKLARYAGSTGDGGDHEKPIAELRARLGSQPAMTKPSKAPEGFVLVPVEQAKHAERYQWVRQADAAVIETLAWTADSADDFDRRVDEEISAPKGDSHE